MKNNSTNQSPHSGQRPPKKLSRIPASILGILGWLFNGMFQILASVMIVGALVALLIYAKVRPELDHCRSVAYDKLAQMQRSDFSMLSDTEVYDKDGRQIGLINAGHYEYVPISQISMNIQNAYIAQEDRRFKSHSGVDWIATFRAGLSLVKNKGEIRQGGSTITQQVVKNTYLTQERSFTRKIVEILLAPEIEKKYSKADIMEFYCNTNFYGHHCYGVQAASRYYFGKNAEDLQPYEAAVLVGISNSPSAYDPVKHPEESLKKRNDVLLSMLEVGDLTQEQYDSYTAQPLNIVQEESEGTDENYQSSYAIHCAALYLMSLDGFEFRYTFSDKDDYKAYMDAYQTAYNDKNDEIRSGGYRIYTSLDSQIQAELQVEIDKTLASYTELQDNGKFALQGAGVIVDNQSNYVVAIVGGRGTEDIYNRAYLSARQPGSTIKPLLDYGPAFDTGEYYPARIVNDHKWTDGPSNSGGNYFGNVTVREALNRSLNTVAWQVLCDVGVEYGLNYLGEMEFQKLSYIDKSAPSISIGGFTNGVRIVDMAKGYSTLANNGVYNDRTCIVKIEHEQKGELTKDMKEHANRVYQEDSAFMLTDILKGTMTESYGTGRGLALANDMPCAGKTGTTNSSKDTWFCGYTRYYTTAVWVGYDTPRAMPGVYGSTYAGKIWKNVMDQIHVGKEPLDWEMPTTVVEQADKKTGIVDYMSTTADLRAEQNLHDKEQQKLVEELTNSVTSFEDKTIETVEDTYWVKNQYTALLAKINQVDEGEERADFLERVEKKYDTFTPIIANMKDTIDRYEQQKAREKADAQKKAEEEAVKKRKELEAETRRQDFLTALEDVENLEYQAPNASSLIQTAIDKLPEVQDLDKAKEYSDRLNSAIARVSTLPTTSQWQSMQAQKEREENAKQAQDQQQISNEQTKLEQSLRQESRKWNTNSGLTGGPGVTGSTVTANPDGN